MNFPATISLKHLYQLFSHTSYTIFFSLPPFMSKEEFLKNEFLEFIKTPETHAQKKRRKETYF